MLDLDRIADRMESLLLKESDQAEAMKGIAKQFADAGLILDENVPSREEPWMFVQDVLRDNDLIGDYLGLREESKVLQKPALIPSLDSLMSALLPEVRD